VLREALSNIAGHARARTAEVDLTATPDRITLQVGDDGSGVDSPPDAADWPTCADAPNATVAPSPSPSDGPAGPA
jgi:anti-sigma regulatory factor (Ser/Thr protein kinase)